MKKMFVESLGKMIAEYSEATESGLFERIRSLQYVKERGEEYVYALYDEGLEKRICITADSEEAVLIDFANNISTAEWFTSADPRYRDFSQKYEHTSRQMAEKLMNFIRDISDNEEDMDMETAYVEELFDGLQKSKDFNVLAHHLDLMFMDKVFD